MFQILFTTSIVKKDLSYLEKLPNLILEEDQRRAIQWVLEYRKKNGSVPFPSRVQRTEHKRWCQKIFMSTDPLQDIYEQTVEVMKSQCRKMAVEELLNSENGTRMSIVKRLQDIELITPTAEIVSYKDMNRDDLYGKSTGTAIRFGLTTIDAVTKGLLPGEIGFIAGRPGSGKTMILCHIAATLIQEGKTVFFNSKEMPTNSIVSRIDGIIGGFDTSILRTYQAEGGVGDPTLESVVKQSQKKIEKKLSSVKGNIIFPKFVCSTPTELFSNAVNAGAHAILADAVYLMHSDAATFVGDSRDWKVQSSVTKEIKEGSLSTGIPVIGTTQLRRNDKQAVADLSDIAFSDTVGQDSDIIISLQQDKAGLVALQVIKNRNGAQGLGQLLKFNFSTGTITEGGSLNDDDN